MIQADGIKYKIEEKVTDNILYENVLEVLDVQESDYGSYLCVVINERGEDSFPIEFKPTSKFLCISCFFIFLFFFFFFYSDEYYFLVPQELS